MGKFVVIAAWGSDNSWVNSRLTKETWEERLGNEILWRALESSDIFLGIYKLLSCSGLCICSEKTQESLRVPLLTDLEEVCKREVKAIIRHGCKLPSWVLKGCPNTHTRARAHIHTHTHTHTHAHTRTEPICKDWVIFGSKCIRKSVQSLADHQANGTETSVATHDK